MKKYIGNSLVDVQICVMVTIDGEEVEDEIDVEVDFYFSPAEPEVRYYSDMSGYPGCGASIEIFHLYDSGGNDWIDKITSKEMERLEQHILNMKPDYDY